MVNLLPCLLLLLVLVLVQVVSRSRLNIGNQWLILVLSALFTWGTVLFLRSHLPQPFEVTNWLPAGTAADPITMQLDSHSWIFIFGLISLLTGMVLVDTIHLHERTNIREWSRIILVFVLGMAGSLMNSLLAFVLCWTFIDFVALIIQIAEQKTSELPSRSIPVFFLRMIGTFLVLFVGVKNSAGPLNETVFTNSDLSLLIMGAGLRMIFYEKPGLTSKQPLTMEMLEKTRMILPPFLAVVFLSRLEITGEVKGLLIWFIAIAIIVAFFASLNWFRASHPSHGDRSIILYFSALAVISTLRGNLEGAAACGFFMILLIGWIRLYASRFHTMHTFLIIFAFSLLGLPFTITTGLRESLIVGPLSLLNPILWISLALLIAGIVLKAIQPANNGRDLESWMKLFSAIGLLIISTSGFTPGLWQTNVDGAFQYVWISGVIVLLTAVMLVFSLNQKASLWLTGSVPPGWRSAASGVKTMSMKIRESGWVYRLGKLAAGLIQWVVNNTNRILEGEGGILWAFVFLALLLSLLIGSVGG